MPSLRGSRLKIYKNLVKFHRKDLVQTDPQKVYELVKERLLEFQETVPEKRSRYLCEFAMMQKGQLTAHQWLPVFEEGLTNLASVGMSRGENEAFIAYVTKVGPRLSQIILKDHKMREDADGRTTWRTPRTWKEAHKSVVEHEQTELGQRALLRSYRASSSWDMSMASGMPLAQYFPGGKGKNLQSMANWIFAVKGKTGAGKGGKPKGKSTKGGGKGKSKGKGKGKPACHAQRDHGFCANGSNCWYSHDPEVIKRA